MKRLIAFMSTAQGNSSVSFKDLVRNTSFSALFLFILQTSFAQNVIVKGTITSQTGEPLSDVSILVKGSTAGTSTKADGSFEISAPQNSTLIFSYVGFITKEVKLSSGQSNLALQLLTDKNELNQVIVVGYGTRRKSGRNRSHTSISEQAIKDVPASNLHLLYRDKPPAWTFKEMVRTASPEPYRIF
jgi:hypothetical protein